MTYGMLSVLRRCRRWVGVAQIYGLVRIIAALLLLLFVAQPILAESNGISDFLCIQSSTASYFESTKNTTAPQTGQLEKNPDKLLPRDTIPPDSIDEYLIGNDLPYYPVDSLDTLRRPQRPLLFDTLSFSGADTLPPPKIQGTTRQFRVSSDSLEAPVEYAARDSQHIDFLNEEIHLFGQASVKYQQVSLQADHIILNWGTSIVVAEPLRDSLGQQTGLPAFTDGGQEFTAKKLKYNFRTSKGIITDAVTTQEQIVIRGGTTKFVGDAVAVDDTTTADVIYSKGAVFTTCTADHPHYGFRTTKAKIVPNQLAVIGPSNLEIMGVPTPLWLPFGFFPLKSGRSTGLIFPNDYEFSPQWGFGLRDFGWFFPIGEHLNLTLLANYYLKGTYGLGVNGSYRKRYEYSGNFTVRYDKLRQENTETGQVFFDPTFQIRWSHRQDAAAHPTASFGGSINFQTNRAQSQVFNSFQAVSQNVINSNLNFTKRWDDKPFTLTAGLSHSQNNRSREITVNFPQVQFQTSTIYPFRRSAENRVGKERWYEQINFRYRNELRGTFTGLDTSFFTQETLDDSRYGFRQNASTGISFKVLKYFTLAPSVNYEETYYTRRQSRIFDPTTGIGVDSTFDDFGELVIDTTDFGTIIESLDPGLYAIREFSAGVSLETQFFGTVRFRKGKLRGLRHIVKPRVSFGYQPDYLDNPNYFSPLVDTTNLDRKVSPFDRFQGEIFGGAPRSEEQIGLSYGITNTFAAKIFNKRDSTTENIVLLQNLNINGNYNFVADSLKWSPVRMSTGTKFFKGLTQLTLSAVFDPYERVFTGGSSMGERVNITTLSASQVPFKLTQLTGGLNTNITVARIRQLFQGAEEEVVTDVRAEREKRLREEQELFEETDLLSLLENFSISHQYRFNVNRLVDESGTNAPDTLRYLTTVNNINLRGRIRLTENWSVNISNIGYDFVNKGVTYPFLGISRDLHCWEMRFDWAPVRGTYSFSIGVKPGVFDFLNVPYQRNRIDAEQLGGNQF